MTVRVDHVAIDEQNLLHIRVLSDPSIDSEIVLRISLSEEVCLSLPFRCEDLAAFCNKLLQMHQLEGIGSIELTK